MEAWRELLLEVGAVAGAAEVEVAAVAVAGAMDAAPAFSAAAAAAVAADGIGGFDAGSDVSRRSGH